MEQYIIGPENTITIINNEDLSTLQYSNENDVYTTEENTIISNSLLPIYYQYNIDYYDEEGITLTNGVFQISLDNTDVFLQITDGTEEAITSGINVVSTIFDVQLFDNNGNPIQPSTSITLCFESQDKDDVCLGSYSEEKKEWECDDRCLEYDDNGNVCGDIDHLTNVGLLLNGGSGSDSVCGSSENDYILGSALYDFILILSCVVVCCCIALFIIIFGTFTKRGKEVVGYRYKTQKSDTFRIEVHE